ncbi:endolytic transglycosylase MltG [Kocuria sp. JC486]|uniref:Endolytic murein transglycosylase n=3 Tax=Micrococcaceae TaxID=1268 RepID=A0A3N3ZT71_9MICC|nr:endolytic transglycosylase MltG [Kocuria sp. JC486]NHU84130.1 endolytic transglycosylase MltG [Kocuria sp. JC486]ROZ64815.1 endolytic transglycosylase MltG [Kocuria soli]
MSLVGAIALFTVAAVFAFAVVGNNFGWFERKDYRGEGKETVNYTIAEGASTQEVAMDLANQDIVANGERFIETFNENHEGEFIQPGDYELRKKMSSEAAVSVLMDEGDPTHYAAVPTTVRMDETFQILSDSTGIPTEEFEAAAEDTSAYGIPDEFPTIEGYLHPGEYNFPLDASAEEILQEMVDRTKQTLKDNDVSDEDAFRVLTVASIVEFEGVPDIYPDVAGAIYNRIDRPDEETGGFLQSDATVAYGLGEKTYEITEEEKQDKDNEYNTFAHQGLPAGPIGSPGNSSIEAAAKPAENDYYYWVTVNLDTGETKFATNYADHEKNVDEYQSWCSDNPGKCE